MSRFPSPTRVLALLGLLAALSALLGLALGAAGADAYSLSASPSVDTPERDVTFASTTYTITEVARVLPGESVTVDSSGDSGYRVQLYNTDKQIVQTWDRAGDDQISLDTDGLPTGTYLFVLQDGGRSEAVLPFVIADYEVTVSAPTEAAEDATINATVTVGATTGGADPIDELELVVGDDDAHVRTTLPKTGPGTYEGQLSLDGLAPDTYPVYAVARGSETVYGEQVALGLNEAPESLEVTAPQTPTPTATPTPTPTATATPTATPGGSAGGSGGAGGGGGGGGGGVPSGTTAPPSTTADPTASPTATSPTPTVATPDSPGTTATSGPRGSTGADEPTAGPGDSTDSPNAATTTSPSSVITPAPSPTPTGSVTVQQSPFPTATVLVGVLFGALALVRRRR